MIRLNKFAGRSILPEVWFLQRDVRFSRKRFIISAWTIYWRQNDFVITLWKSSLSFNPTDSCDPLRWPPLWCNVQFIHRNYWKLHFLDRLLNYTTTLIMTVLLELFCIKQSQSLYIRDYCREEILKETP